MGLTNHPCIVQSLDSFFRQRTLLKVCQIILQIAETPCTQNNRIGQLASQCRVMNEPPQRHLGNSQAMFLRHRFDDLQGVVIAIVPQMPQMHIPDRLASFVPPREKPASQWRVHVERDAVVAQAREQLILDAALQRMVMSFIDGRFDPAVLFADLADLRNLPRHVVAQAEPIEVAFAMELVHRAEGVLEWVLAVRPVQIEHLDLVRLERF